MPCTRPHCRLFAGTLLIALVALGGRTSLGEFRGDIELLKMIADGYEANLNRLATWRGRACIRSRVTEGDNPPRVARYQADFLVDRKREAVKWTWFSLPPDEPAQLGDGTSGLNRQAGLSTRDCDYLVYLYDYGLPSEERSLHIYPKDGWPRHFQGTAFDPLRILTKEIYPGLVEQLRGYYRLQSEGRLGFSNGTITRQGDLVTVETDNTREGYGRIVTRFVFDLSKGCCPIEFFHSYRNGKSHWRLEYEEIAGVFVPKSISLLSENKNHDPTITEKRTATLTTTMVNELVNEGEFSLGRLGLKAGDPINDRRTGCRYRFGEPGATEADMPPDIAQPLVNTRLPTFKRIQIDLPEEETKGRIMLVCFFDVNQRPSRHCVVELARRTESLEAGGVRVVAVQASKTDPNELDTWTAEQEIAFPVGRIADNVRETKATWGVRSLPWLILTDKQHIIRAEGFAPSELDAKLAEVAQAPQRAAACSVPPHRHPPVAQKSAP